MSSHSERRQEARVEALIKLGFLSIAGIALLIGGISGFVPTLMLIIILLVGGAFLLLAGLLISKSRLMPAKKIGVGLIVASVAAVCLWPMVKAPRQWVESQVVVANVNGPPAVTETIYSYHPEENVNPSWVCQTVQTRQWAQLSDAKKYRAGPELVYVNPRDANDVRFTAVQGWTRATAKPGLSRYHATGDAKVTLRNPGLFPTFVEAMTPRLSKDSIGQTISIWVNPVDRSQFSFEPHETQGGKKYWMLIMAGLLAVGGISSLFVGEEWLAPPKIAEQGRETREPTVKRLVAAAFGPRVQPSLLGSKRRASEPTVSERLDAIDWFQFEAICARILEAEGWRVERSGGARPDGGADLVATRNGRRTVVQCKHWQHWQVKPNVIRELLGTKTSTQFVADDAILFASGGCTVAGRQVARENNVRIIGRTEIEEGIHRIGVAAFPALLNPDDKRCPKCGARMVLRENVAKPFWGCSTYPRCRGKIERVREAQEYGD